ncbi:MAG: hypothetical protein LUH45_02810 [Clostridiales bacterium]|nr:hypothetical protein [Clostridiales bacterium]
MPTPEEEYPYTFATGETVTLSLPQPWVRLLRELDRREANSDQRENRRHCSLERYDPHGTRIPLRHSPFEPLEERDTWETLCRALSPQEIVVGDLYFRRGYRQREISALLGLTQGRVSQLISYIRHKLKNFPSED